MGHGVGSTIRSAILHAPGAVRDYLIGAGQFLNLFPVYSYETLQTSDREALTSDVVTTYVDLNQTFVTHCAELLELIKSKTKEEGATTEDLNVEEPRGRDARESHAARTAASAGID
jgi:hypothetical protein